MILCLAVVAAAQSYTLEPEHSTLAVLVSYDRSALLAGHDHVVRPRRFSGTVLWTPTECDIQISFPVTELRVDGGSRSLFGLTGQTSSTDRAKIRDNLLGRHVLSAGSFPLISFSSHSCIPEGDKFRVTGALQIHGVSHQVSTLMTVTADDVQFKGVGSFHAVHADWGMEPFRALLGSLRNAPELRFRVEVMGSPR